MSSSKPAYPFGFALDFLIKCYQFLPSTWKTKLVEIFLPSGAESVHRSLGLGRPFFEVSHVVCCYCWGMKQLRSPCMVTLRKDLWQPKVALPLVTTALCCGSAASADELCNVSSPGICCEVIWHLRLRQAQRYSLCSFRQDDAVVIWLALHQNVAVLLPEHLQYLHLFFSFFSL